MSNADWPFGALELKVLDLKRETALADRFER
jgi:hypothetical protein